MKIYWFDCETSGLDPAKNAIISLAALVEIDGEIVERINLCMNPAPGKVIEDGALKVNGFTREQLLTFPASNTVFVQLRDFMDSYLQKYNKQDRFVAAGYNVGFDLRFLEQFFKENGDTYLYARLFGAPLDVMSVVRFMQVAGVFPKTADNKLSTVAKAIGKDAENAHDAMADIEMTRAIHKYMDGHFVRHEKDTF
jgi:DNA polymerase III subunit epsilon